MSTDSKARSFTVLNRPLTVILAITGQFVIAGHLVSPVLFYFRYGGLWALAGPEVIFGVISAIALLRKADFSWWFALVIDLSWVVLVFYAERAVSWDVVETVGLPLSVAVLLLTPSARSFYRTTNFTSLQIHPS
jgi:FtsH-binding integral membrane protein